MEIFKDVGYPPPKNPTELRVQTYAFIINTFQDRVVVVDKVIVNPSEPSNPEIKMPMPEFI